MRPAIASHNLRSVAHAIAGGARARARGPRPRAPGAARARRRPRGGARRPRPCACGSTARWATWWPGMAYLVRRLLENTVERVVPRRAAARHADRGAARRAVSFRNEPILELRRAPARESLLEALRGARRPAAARGPGADRRRARRGDGLRLHRPGRARRGWWRAPDSATEADAAAAVEAAERGFRDWGARDRRPSAPRCCARAAADPARAPARAGGAPGARVREAVARGRRRRVRGDRLPRVLRARGGRARRGPRARAGAGRAQHDALRAARRGGGDRALELPARDPLRHDRRRRWRPATRRC